MSHKISTSKTCRISASMEDDDMVRICQEESCVNPGYIRRKWERQVVYLTREEFEKIRKIVEGGK